MLVKRKTNIPLFPVQQDSPLLVLGGAFSRWDPVRWQEIKIRISKVCLDYEDQVVAIACVCSYFPFHKYFHLHLKTNGGGLHISTPIGKLFQRLTPVVVLH